MENFFVFRKICNLLSLLRIYQKYNWKKGHIKSTSRKVAVNSVKSGNVQTGWPIKEKLIPQKKATSGTENRWFLKNKSKLFIYKKKKTSNFI